MHMNFNDPMLMRLDIKNRKYEKTAPFSYN
jgi:hypothetical protein